MSWETDCRIGMAVVSDCSPTFPPRFNVSAWSKLRLNSFCSASVYWFPPKEMSRQKMEFMPDSTLTLVTEAPMFTSATTRPGVRA